MLELLALLPTIWIVDASAGPGTNFTDLPPAIAAAQSGDTILVRSGPIAYAGFTVSGKVLTIRREGAGTVRCGLIDIGLLPAGEAFVIAGLRCLEGIRVDCAGGAITLLDCTATGAAGGIATSGLVLQSGSLHAERCEFHGGDCLIPMSLFSWGGSGADVLGDAILVADHCYFGGGICASGGQYVSHGGMGCFLAGTSGAGFVDLRDSNLYGGWVGQAAYGSSGGDALRIQHGAARLAGNATTAQGGTGISTSGRAVFAETGTSATVHTGVTLFPAGSTPPTYGVQFDPREMPRLSLAGALKVNDETDATQPATVHGQWNHPGELFFFAAGFRPAFDSLDPFVIGSLQVDLGSGGLVAGLLDATGAFQTTMLPTAVFGSVLGVPFYTQAAVWDAPSAQLLTSNAVTRIFTL